jgi:hypothetical protein
MQIQTKKVTLCPSAQADSPNRVVFGIVGGTVEAPRITYLERTEPLTDELVRRSHPVTPTEIFRMATLCATKKCLHFDGANCRLAKQIVEELPGVVEELPACSIRRDCRWWQQEGKAACMRCPQVITDSYNPSDLLYQIGIPQPVKVAELQNSDELTETELVAVRGGAQRHTFDQLKALKPLERSGAQPA